MGKEKNMKKYRRKKSSLLILVMLWGGLEPKASKNEGEKDFTQSPRSGKPREDTKNAVK